MSTTYPLTHFSILSFPTKFNPPTKYFPLNNPCLSQRLNLSHKFFCRKYTNIITRRRRRGFLMEERVIRIPALRAVDDEENIGVLEQESLVGGSPQLVSSQFESTLNSLSKWLVAALFSAVILWRHDAEALWAAMGSVINSMLSVILKRLLNQERPVSNLRRSDPGMPSSHAQSIFFTVVFVVLSMVEWLGVNELTLILTAGSLAFGSYLSWLRVSQQLHTISQVVVGAVLGFCFSLLWFWSWDAAVSNAFSSVLWVRVSVFLGSVICCLGFLLYIVLNWFTDERGNL